MDYSVIQPNKKLRAQSRQQLQGVWGEMALAFFILFLIYLLIKLPDFIFSFLDLIQEPIPEILSYFGINTGWPIIILSLFGTSAVLSMITFIVEFAIKGPFMLGFAGLFLKRIRGQEIAAKNIFDGFQNFFPSFILWLLTALFTFLWGMLFIIPGIIKGFSYSMAFYIMYDNPEIEPIDALKKSQIMMKGYKWKLFVLTLSFIGWILLGLLTLGIGYFWLYPYISLSMANFYENLKISQESKI